MSAVSSGRPARIDVTTPLTHISARLAWHDDGWNGCVCSDPRRNTYCVGPSSYPGDVIAERRDLEWESREDVAGRPCGELDAVPPCVYSINAFSEQGMVAVSDPPDFFRSGEQRRWDLPPGTSCVWPYEAMYSDEVRDGNRRPDAAKRRAEARAYFDALSPGRSLVFYYANYSNPFSEEDARRYVVVGVSRLKQVGEELFYDGVSAESMERYGGFVWARNVTNSYPDEGFRLPYHRFRDDREALERFLVVPANPRSFKYGSRHVSDDDALTVVDQLLEAVGRLRELDDDERWEERQHWLFSVVAELWSGRGLYPGLLRVLDTLELGAAIPWTREQAQQRSETEVRGEIFALLDGSTDALPGLALEPDELRSARRRWMLREDDERHLLAEILPRFDLSAEQIKRIVSDRRADHGVDAGPAEIAANPYLLVEQYAGNDPDDSIPFAKIDNGMLPSPELGGETLADKDDWRRLRALCVERLRRERQHAFLAAGQAIDDVNERLGYMPEWKRHRFNERYLEVDEERMTEALTLRTDGERRRFIYLRRTFEDERRVEEVLRRLSRRPDVELRKPLGAERWQAFLVDPENAVRERDPTAYQQVVEGQAQVCEQIFRRPLSVVCGDAGTGKTTVVRALIEAVRHTEGSGAAIRLLAPTGKAADRLRDRTGQPASTVHSFLASKGFLNPNLTFRTHGERVCDVSTCIVDEASMLDLGAVATLCRAIEWEGVRRLILVGDPSQLPPIGAGKVFAETIDWLAAETPEAVGRLEQNVRQLENAVSGRGTGILDLAELYVRERGEDAGSAERRARAEEVLGRVQVGGEVDQDLRVLYWRDPEDLESQLLDVVLADAEADTGRAFDPEKPWELWDALWGLDCEGYERRPENQQVISPFRGEPFGVERLNELLQRRMNGHTVDSRGTLGGIAFFDKVIQVRNSSSHHRVLAYNFEKRETEWAQVYNGELGFARPDVRDKKTWRWQRVRRFQVGLRGKEHLGLQLESEGAVEANLEPAYAISVHKSQGSEFRRVYFVVPKHKQALLTTELFYTGLTRAQSHCTLLIEEDVEALLSLRRRERSQLNRINSSLFELTPLPDELLALGDWYEEGKVHRALSGHLVRSKSEVIIANLLHERELPFSYEMPLFAPDGTFYLPDFTVQAGGETWYWEHWGRMDLERYRDHAETKRRWYERHFPGRLLETHESGELSDEAAAVIASLP
jgi:exodeoxyribonuclease V alpha subunit